MMKKYISSLFIALSVLSSCTDKGYDVVKSFPEEGEATLAMEIPYNPTEYFLSSITWTDGYWVYRLRDEPFFVLLDSNYNEIARFGRKGNGPQEFLSPMLSKVTSGTDSVDVCFYDWSKGRLYNASVNKNNGDVHITDLKDFGKRMRYVYALDDGRYICSAENNRYYFLEKNGQEHYLEGWDDDVNEAAELSSTYVPIFQSRPVISPDCSMFAVYSISHQILILHDISGKRINIVYISEEPDMQLYDSNIGTFNGLVFLGNVIVALYESVKDESSYLMVFDRKLAPLKRYKLSIDGNMLTGNPKEGVVTVLSYDDEKMYCYDLSEWI